MNAGTRIDGNRIEASRGERIYRQRDRAQERGQVGGDAEAKHERMVRDVAGRGRCVARHDEPIADECFGEEAAAMMSRYSMPPIRA